MVLLYHYNIKENVKFLFIFKPTIFIFMIWMYIAYKNMNIFPKSLENKNEHGKILSTNPQRLLAKHELHKELGYTREDGHLLHNRIDKNKKNVADDITILSQLNKKGSNNVENYMKNYKRRYEKKKGLYKLDCYCEKKLFDKINYIYTLSDKMKNDKKGFKKKIRKKYGTGLIILSLIPALGLIFYILFGLGEGLNGVFKLCWDRGHYTGGSHRSDDCKLLKEDEWNRTLVNVAITNEIFSFTIVTMVLLFFIYIVTKVIKYEKLKAGKGKMRINEYYRFCKEFF